MGDGGSDRVEPVEGLLLTGTSGVGKSTVALEVFEQLVAVQRGSAFVDLDAIARCDADDDDGFFGSAIMAENLQSVWPNYRRRGVVRLVLARAVPDAVELNRIQASLPDVRLTVALLIAAPGPLAVRLAGRDSGARQGRYATTAVELQEQMSAAGIADFTVDNGESRSVSAVAAEISEQWAARVSRHASERSSSPPGE